MDGLGMRERRCGCRTLPLLVAGILAGSLAITPAVAHVTRGLKHLHKHLDKRYAKKADTYTKSETDALIQTKSGGDIVAFASIAVETGTPQVLNFGGSGTTSVMVEDFGVGDYGVRFLGSFPTVTESSKFTPIVTIRDTDFFNVASSDIGVVPSSPTEIRVDVKVWNTQTSAADDRDVSVMVLA